MADEQFVYGMEALGGALRVESDKLIMAFDVIFFTHAECSTIIAGKTVKLVTHTLSRPRL